MPIPKAAFAKPFILCKTMVNPDLQSLPQRPPSVRPERRDLSQQFMRSARNTTSAQLLNALLGGINIPQWALDKLAKSSKKRAEFQQSILSALKLRSTQIFDLNGKPYDNCAEKSETQSV
jgi:hypothetical protein